MQAIHNGSAIDDQQNITIKQSKTQGTQSQLTGVNSTAYLQGDNLFSNEHMSSAKLEI